MWIILIYDLLSPDIIGCYIMYVHQYHYLINLLMSKIYIYRQL